MSDQKDQSEKDLKKQKKHKLTPEQELKQQCEEYLNGWQRANADYQNLQKQTDKRMSEYRQFAQEDLLQQLFPLADYFDSAFAHTPDGVDENWLQGFKYIEQNFNKILEDNGVSKIKTVGQQFDPELHECVKEVKSEQKPNTIIKQTQAGFKLNNKVVRPAKVIISKK